MSQTTSFIKLPAIALWSIFSVFFLFLYTENSHAVLEDKPEASLFLSDPVLSNVQSPEMTSPAQELDSSRKPNYSPGELIVKFKSSGAYAVTEDVATVIANGSGFAAATQDASNSLDQLHFAAGVVGIERLFIKKNGLSLQQAQADLQNSVNQIKQKFSSRTQRIPTDAIVPELANIYLFKVSTSADVEELANMYRADPHVEYAQPNYMAQIYMVPNDPFYHSTGSWTQSYSDLWSLKADKMKMEPAWDLTRGSGVVVAVLDTGLDYNHPDILNNVWRNPDEIAGNSVDDDANGFIDDVRGWDFFSNDNDPLDRQGHGTHVSGTIAAVGNNGLGIIGISHQAKIMPVKGLSDQGYGTFSDLAKGLKYAADNGADVINNSWGCGAPCPSIPVVEDAVRYAYQLGAVVVFAAGNSNDDVANYSPQNMSEPIKVAATDQDDEKAFFSNYGTLINVAAPGGGKSTPLTIFAAPYNILSLKAAQTGFPADLIVQNNYLRLAGTSMACPHAAGLAALLIARYPLENNTTVMARMMASSDPFPVNYPQGLGTGRINAHRALTIAPQPFVLVKKKIFSEKTGDRDKIFESGEEISLTVELKNIWKNAASVQASITTLSPLVTLGTSTTNYGSIANGQSKTNATQPFTFTIGKIITDSLVEMTLTVNADGKIDTYPLKIYLGVRNVTSMESYSNEVETEGDYVVYGTHADLTIALYDLKTDTKKILSTQGFYPNISNKKVVWKEYSSVFPNSEIYLYDITTGQTRRITNVPSEKSAPDIHNNKIVWSDKRDGNWNIYLYDLTTNQERRLTNLPTKELAPQVYGDNVVWSDTRHVLPGQNRGLKDYYLLNLTTGVEKRLTPNTLVRYGGDFYDNKIVYSEARRTFEDVDVFMINTTTGIKTTVASGPSSQGFPKIYGNRIVWHDLRESSTGYNNSDIFLYDLTTGLERQITREAHWQVIPDISGNRIVWIDQRNGGNEIYLTEIDFSEPVPAQLKTPQPGTSLTSSTVTFSWSPATAGWPYGLFIGTRPGASNIYANAQLIGLSVSLTSNAFVSGLPIYVQLTSPLPDGVSTALDYTFTTGGVFSPAEIISPIPGTTLVGDPTKPPYFIRDLTFKWTPGIGAAKYWMNVFSQDFFKTFPNLTGTQISALRIPLAGKPIVVQLWSFLNGAWVNKEYIYQTLAPEPPQLVGPPPGSIISTSNVTFNWNPGIGIEAYRLWVGTTGAGSSDVYNKDLGLNTTAAVTGIAMNGQPLYVRLGFKIVGVWYALDYIYTRFLPVKPFLVQPTPNAVLDDGLEYFSWTSGTFNVQEYRLSVGTQGPGSTDIYHVTHPNNSFFTKVSIIPLNGQPVYARLSFKINNVWESVDSMYTAIHASAITVPLPNSTLNSANVTFQWNNGGGQVTANGIAIGTCYDIDIQPSCFRNIYQGPFSSHSQELVNNIPLNGNLIYVRLWSRITGFPYIPGAIFAYQAGTQVEHNQKTAVNQNFTNVALQKSFAQNPVVLASIATFADSDPAGIRIQDLSLKSFSIKAEEEKSLDSDITHTAETVGYSAFSQGHIINHNKTVIGETKILSVNQISAAQWRTVTLSKNYVQPVVFMQVVSNRDPDPAHIRIRNVTATSFQYQIEEWDYQDKIHGNEDIAYVVIEKGIHTLMDGRKIEAGTVDAQHIWVSVNFLNLFTAAPIVVSQAQTHNNASAIVTRHRNITAQRFDVRLQEEAKNDTVHPVERVGYLVIGR